MATAEPYSVHRTCTPGRHWLEMSDSSDGVRKSFVKLNLSRIFFGTDKYILLFNLI